MRVRASLALLLVLGAVARAEVERVLVPIKNVRPTQMEVGLAFVARSVKEIKRRGTDLAEAIASKAIRAQIGPDGIFYINDGHHWALAAHRLLELHPELKDKLRLDLHVDGDFRGRTWEEFALYLYDRNIGYFSPEVRRAFERLQEDGKLAIPRDLVPELYRLHLPSSLDAMTDSPARSALGMAFKRLGLRSRDYGNYVEFFLVEILEAKLSALGITAGSPAESLSSDLIDKVAEALAQDSRAIDFLLSHTNPDHDRADVTDRLMKAIAPYRERAKEGTSSCAAFLSARERI